MRTVAAGLWVLMIVRGTAAQAAPLDFDLTAQSSAGTVGYAGGSAPLLGTNLQVATVTGVNSPANPNQVLTLTGGALNFETGAFLGTGAGGNQWEFGGGGSLTLTGALPSLGITDPKTVLLSGSFADNPFVSGVGAGDLKVEGAGFLNLVNSTLASYFGLPTGTAYFGGLSTLFSAPGTPGSAFSGADYLSGHLTTDPSTIRSTPEPSTLLGFGLGLAALVLHFHRRRGSENVS